MKKPKMEVFDNIWDAIEDDPVVRANLKARTNLMLALSQHIKASGWTQIQAAKALGVTQPRISDLLRGKIDLFTIDTLVNMLASAGFEIDIQVMQAAVFRAKYVRV